MIRRVLLVLLGALLLGACRVDGVVEVVVDRDGSGTVSVGVALDAEAAAVVPDLAQQLRLADLRDAGWTVTGPAAEADGLSWIRATKPFADPDQFGEVMKEISANTLFRDFELVRARSFAQTRYSVTGEVDWTGGTAVFSDPALTEALLGVPLGFDDAELAEMAGGSLDERMQLTVNVRLPDDARGNAEELSGSTGTWVVRLADTAPTRIELTGTVEDTAPRVWAAVAIITGGLAVLLILLGILGAVLRRLRKPSRPVRTKRAAEIVEEPPTPRPRERRLELVVLGGTRVVFDAGDGDEGLLVPFVRAAGSQVPLEHIAACHRSASLGRMTAAEFWRAVEVEGEPAELDLAYLSKIRLMPGLMEFLERTGGRSLRVACLTNAVLAWSHVLRSEFDLGAIDPWIVSAEVGARKPSRAMFEALRRTTGVPFENCLLIDSIVATLDAGQKLGMSTVWFAPPGTVVPDGFAHRVVTSFDELLGAARAG